jgi:putative DNA primase/helicase
MLILELGHSFFGEEDPDLTAKLLAELPGILQWAIDGWNRLRQRGHFEQPTSSAGLIDDLEDLASPVAAWVRQRCVKGAGEQVVCTAAYADFKQWCQEQGHQHVATSTMFGRDLKAAAGASRVQIRDGLIRQGAYRGIRLRTLEERDDAS